MKKVLVTGHDLKFWRPLQESLQKTGLFEFREDEWTGHESHNSQKTLDGILWADIVLAEWMLGNAVFCAKNKKAGQRLITRLHLQERGTIYPDQIDYTFIDMVIFVGPHIREECINKFNIPREKTCVIGNFVDINKFNKSKFGGSEFNLGIIGTVPSRKRLDIALDTLEHLLDMDERYTLSVKGPSPASYDWLWARTKEREYYEKIYERINSSEKLRYRVIFDPPGNDVEFWFRKIGYILSPSDFESFHMAVSEGMLCETIPVVWKWDGASEIYPILDLQTDSSEAASYVNNVRKSNIKNKLAYQAKNFIVQNYSNDVITEKWIKAINGEDGYIIKKHEKHYKKILVVHGVDKWESFHRSEMLKALSVALLNEFILLYIEPGTHYKTLLNKNIASKEELLNYASLKPIQIEENLYKMRVLLGGIPSDANPHPIALNWNNYSTAINEICAVAFGSDLKITNYIYKPNTYSIIDTDIPYIYEVYDEYTMNFETGVQDFSILELEKKVLNNAHHVFFTSNPLADRKSLNCSSWSMIGNGLDFNIFKKYTIPNNTPEDGRRTVGYLGNLSDFFNWQLMLDVVKRMKNVDFIFHGQIEYDKLKNIKNFVDEIMALPNVQFTGRVSREYGAAAINRYDVLIIPFVINDAMHAVNPLKLWEYLSTGLPIVMTPMDAVDLNVNGLYVATTVDEWINSIELSFELGVTGKESRINLAESKDWLKIAVECHQYIN